MDTTYLGILARLQMMDNLTPDGQDQPMPTRSEPHHPRALLAPVIPGEIGRKRVGAHNILRIR
ncbi:hypothetical protein APS60_00455 [Cutibacterium acnes]|uniref:Uncharacterized protein n=1 Tax=Cutibacterium acnes TaxID=1747 RepID=A0AA44U5W1_CUTAC|nr:hypothetical protein APS59_00995 [Cutibacterium acnes]PGF41100.1 hypothetical protein B1B14_02510 [Cutibacterium acnes subsp. defendens]PGF56877.1 hypothetical protein B1C76_02595 [Cutibacterium acnes subsp. defendens]PHJ27999.1 hypothetical protein APS60_00455 [Cutibacterium acnes]PIS93704.1 hypothetical protein CER06_04470 [Cutibacterium acnes]